MSGVRIPPSSGYYDKVILAEQEAERIIPTDVNTGSILIQSFEGDDTDQPENEGVVYIGFDDDVTDENGFALAPGDAISVDLQNEAQGVYAYPEVEGDQVRVIATN